MKSRSTQNSHLLLYNLLSITNIHLLVFIKKKYHEKHPIMFFFFRNVLRSCNILWTTTYTIYGENDFMSQEQHLTCVRFCFVFVWVFFSTSNARGWLESASNNIPHFSISTEKYRQLGILLIPRCKSKNISMCKLHHSASVSMTLVPQYL